MTLPLTIAPMLAVSAPPFDDPDYHFELKWTASVVSLLTNTTRLQSRSGRIISGQYPELAVCTSRSKPTTWSWTGRSSPSPTVNPAFSGCKAVCTPPPRPASAKQGAPIRPLRRLRSPLPQGRICDEPAAGHPARTAPLRRCPRPSFPDQHPYPHAGTALFARAAALGLEGVVGKDKNSPYLPAKKSLLEKARVVKNNDFVICGYTTNPRTARSRRHPGRTLRREQLRSWFGRNRLQPGWINHLLSLRRFKTDRATAGRPPTLANLHWLEPRLVCGRVFRRYPRPAAPPSPLQRPAGPAAHRLPG